MKFPYRSHPVVSDIGLPPDRRASIGTSHPRLPQLLFSFQLKFLWVFQDRKRFDNVIEQLDFLLSNLEKISETLQSRRGMAENTGSEQGRASSRRNHTETQEKHESKCEPYIIYDIIDVVVHFSSRLPAILFLIQV